MLLAANSYDFIETEYQKTTETQECLGTSLKKNNLHIFLFLCPDFLGGYYSRSAWKKTHSPKYHTHQLCQEKSIDYH
jgi:hypothetical protein